MGNAFWCCPKWVIMPMSRAMGKRCLKKSAEIKTLLEARALREIRLEWEAINHNLFGQALVSPVFVLGNAAHTLGAWRRSSRELEISRRAVWDLPWTVVIETLKHETAHQYVDEVLGIRDETAHGPTFRRVCEDRRIDPRRALKSHQAYEAPREESRERRIARRIAGLLALAGSANVHEAHSAMNAAGRMMLKYNIEADQAKADADYSFCHLGQPSGRVRESRKILAAILVRFFFVVAIWVPVYRPRQGKRARILEICGKPHNLEIAAFVHDFLNNKAERLWRIHKEEHGIASNRDRLRFHAGVMNGFYRKLEQQGEKNREEGLVWAGDSRLQRYFKGRFPSVTRTYGRPKKIHAAFAHGHEAGKQIVLHRAVQETGTGGKLLPGGNEGGFSSGDAKTRRKPKIKK